jgi:regulatory protein
MGQLTAFLMPTITAIEPQQHDPERVSIFLDGEYAFGTTLMLAYARNLTVGRHLTAEEVESIQRDDEVDRAFGVALNFLSFRPRSARELRDYLRRRKTEPEVIDAALERLERNGFLDDAEFARFWVENRQSFRPRGTRALKAELRLKGVDTEVIEGALEELGDEEDTAYRAGEKKAASLRSVDEREFFTRMLGFLQRRGFPYAAAAAAAKRLYRTVHEADPENIDLSESG